jgi:hypothetical protein
MDVLEIVRKDSVCDVQQSLHSFKERYNNVMYLYTMSCTLSINETTIVKNNGTIIDKLHFCCLIGHDKMGSYPSVACPFPELVFPLLQIPNGTLYVDI